LNEFLKKMTGAYFVTNDMFSDFSSSGQWVMGTNNMKLSGLKIIIQIPLLMAVPTLKTLKKCKVILNYT